MTLSYFSALICSPLCLGLSDFVSHLYFIVIVKERHLNIPLQCYGLLSVLVSAFKRCRYTACMTVCQGFHWTAYLICTAFTWICCTDIVHHIWVELCMQSRHGGGSSGSTCVSQVLRRPHEFKIRCLEDIRALFPSDWNPFYAGFGNRDTDEISYLTVGVPASKCFIINPKGGCLLHLCDMLFFAESTHIHMDLHRSW